MYSNIQGTSQSNQMDDQDFSVLVIIFWCDKNHDQGSLQKEELPKPSASRRKKVYHGSEAQQQTADVAAGAGS